MRLMTEEEALDIYRDRDAVWFYEFYPGPNPPHAELSSGLCSDGYINSAPVMSDPWEAQRLAWQLVCRLHLQGIGNPDWVVGSAYAAITFSYEVAKLTGANHGFTEKDPANPKRQIWSRFVIPRGATVLQCEELITTMGTTMEVRRAIEEGNPEPVNFFEKVATAIYRPAKLDEHYDLNVIALVAREVKSWKPEECPLCSIRSPRLRPKSHWAELTRKS